MPSASKKENDICLALGALDDMELNVKNLFEWDEWANAKVMAALHALPDGDASNKAWSLLAHLVNAQLVWLSRLGKLHNATPAATIWPEADKEDLQKLIPLAIAEWRSALEVCDPEEICVYTNSRGDRFESTMADITTHVLMHGQYHRGQINQIIRQAGGAPAAVDYIFYQRR